MVNRNAQLSLLAFVVSSVSCSSKGKNPDDEPKSVLEPKSSGNRSELLLDAALDEVSSASQDYSDGPKIVGSGSVDGSALRQAIVQRLRADRSPVSVVRGTSALELGKKICESTLGQFSSAHFTNPEDASAVPVLLKPNIGGFAGLKNPKKHAGDNGMKGRTTDPEFVRGVVHCLRAHGYTEITIADSKMADAKEWARLLKVSGYKAMAQQEGVALVAMSDDGVFDVEGDMPGKALEVRGMENTSVPTLMMPKILAEHLEHGLYISLPKIKTHRFSVVSLGIKGLQGTVMYSDKSPAYRQKWRSHRELGSYTKGRKKTGKEDRGAYVRALEIFSERMVDVLEVESPDLVMAEGAPAMFGDGFHTLIPIADMVAIGGSNPVLVDAVGAKFLGLLDNAELAKELGGHRGSPLIEAAAKRFGIDLSEIETKGDGAELVDKPRPLHFIGFAPFELGEAPGEQAVDIPDKTPVGTALGIGSEQVILDGVADEPLWKNARPVSWDTDYAGNRTGIITRVRFAWSSDTLYAFVELEGAGLAVDTTRSLSEERDGLYKEDCVELFLAPYSDNPEHYYEIEIGPYGHWHDIEVDFSKKKRFNASWQSGVRVATTQDADKHRATMEIAISSKELSGALVKGGSLRMGLFRMEGRSLTKNYLAWSPGMTDKPKFHLPEAFGELLLR